MKKLLYNVILVFVSIMVTIFIIEIGIRLVLPSQRHYAVYEDAENDNYVLKANVNLKYNTEEFSHSAITNSQGFRNKKEFINNNIILFIGDSFTFGSGVDEEFHYSSIFDKRLNRDNKKYNVCNAGVPGYSTVNEYLFINELISKGIDIKKIILGVHISDFNENLLFPTYDVQGDRLVFSTKEKKSFMVKGLNFLAANSELVNLVYYKIIHSSILKNYCATILKLNYFSINLPDKNVQLFAKQRNDESTKKLHMFKRYLIKITELCKANNVELYVYYIPMFEEVHKDSYLKMLDTFDYKDDDFDLGFVNNYIRKACLENKVYFLDLKKDIMNSRDEKLYYPIDQHFTKSGNLIAGKSLYNQYKNDKKQ